MCDPDPHHSHGLQMISGVKDNRRAMRDYLNEKASLLSCRAASATSLSLVWTSA
jgi:hypothetical protein